MADQGWIKLYRKIRCNGLWPNNRKYSPLEAWLDLLLSANHNGNKILIDSRIVTVNRGEFVTSIVKLSERWQWNRRTVQNFLIMLENEKMITKKCTTKYTSVTIANYDFYQSDSATECTSECTSECTAPAQQNAHKQECKNDKNEKNDNKRSLFIPPTLEEVKKYCEERGKGVNHQKWFDFYTAKGWMVGKNKMKDWKAAVRTWEKDNNGGTNGDDRGNFNASNQPVSRQSNRYNSRPLD